MPTFEVLKNSAAMARFPRLRGNSSHSDSHLAVFIRLKPLRADLVTTVTQAALEICEERMCDGARRCSKLMVYRTSPSDSDGDKTAIATRKL